MQTIVTTRLKRQQVRELIRKLPALLQGHAPDPTGLARGIRLRIGMTTLSLCKQAYVTKAAGGTDEAGQSWQPLRPGTRAKQGSRQILRDTGRLLNSLSPGLPGNILDSRPGEIIIGTNVSYAQYHQSGTPRMPARPLWPPPRTWPASWWRQIQQQARDGLILLVRQLLGGQS